MSAPSVPPRRHLDVLSSHDKTGEFDTAMGASDRGFRALARATVVRARKSHDLDASAAVDAPAVDDVVKRRAISDLVQKLEEGAAGAATAKSAAAAASAERRRSHVTRLLHYAGAEMPGRRVPGIVADVAARRSIAGRLSDVLLTQLLAASEGKRTGAATGSSGR